MFCSKCGSQLPDNSSFCSLCGQPVAPSAFSHPYGGIQPINYTINVPADNGSDTPPSKTSSAGKVILCLSIIGVILFCAGLALQSVAAITDSITEKTAHYSEKADTSKNLSTAKLIYNNINTAIIDYKVNNASYPTDEQLVRYLNEEEIADIPSGISAAVNYDATTGEIKQVWVASTDKKITGSNSGKALACYEPTKPNNTADTAVFKYTMYNVGGICWER